MVKQKLQNIAPFGLRMQPDLKASLEKAARKVPQSLNAEIVARLEHSISAKHDIKDFTDGELIDELIRRWGRDQVLIHLGKSSE